MDDYGSDRLRTPDRGRGAACAAVLSGLIVLSALLSARCARLGDPLAELARPEVVEGVASDEGTVPMRVVRAPGGSVLPLVPVTIQDRGPYDFVLDTGASLSVIGKELAEQVELRDLPAVSRSVGVAGPVEARIARVERWSAAGLALPDKPIAVIDLRLTDSALMEQALGQPIHGLLGSDVLSAFGAVTIDYEQGTLRLGAR
jgi:hypothetical protein